MPVPYSEDLRRKIVQACERGTQSQRAIAEFFSVSQSFVESVWHHYRHSGVGPYLRSPLLAGLAALSRALAWLLLLCLG
jgi:transposase